MELLTNLSSTKRYTDLIVTSSFEQKIDNTPKSRVYQNINNLYIDNYDPTCLILENKDKDIYIKQLLIKIASEIDENKSLRYDKYKYSKKMKSSLIQQGLQLANHLTSLLYLSEYYNKTTILYIDNLKVKIKTSLKDYEKIHIYYKDGVFSLLDEVLDYVDGEFKQLGECLILNIGTIDIYDNYLSAISKYKLQELVEIAKDINISLEKDGKKKIKKELYNEINLYYLNKDI
tara:strand:- start:26 stop:721 length:696 start_codon:yes stop_codon:yes gene_type:complete